MSHAWVERSNFYEWSNVSLRVCNVKMNKILPGWKWGTFPRNLQFMACSIK